MSGLTPYLQFDGTARAALGFYRDVFGGELVVHSFADFGRQDGLGDAVAHGILHGRVELFAADVPTGQDALALRGILFALLGTAEPAELKRWFAALADGGEVLDPLALKPWGDHDGQVPGRCVVI